jgi:uncharacterized membrane protein YeaQ/YmgE (transglycosylase-associated protein family)
VRSCRIQCRTPLGLILDIGIGIIGAFAGGFVFSFFGALGIAGFNLYSMLVAIIGAVVVVVMYHALFSQHAA